jgi:hypothetical protein
MWSEFNELWIRPVKGGKFLEKLRAYQGVIVEHEEKVGT